MYTIFNTTNLHSKCVVANVESIGAAESFLASRGDIICFDIDPDGHDAADCALLRKSGTLEIYAIEAN